ncbi:hypothetical protein L210DRAFT_3531914, partial [Boletus edulis BED1]
MSTASRLSLHDAHSTEIFIRHGIRCALAPSSRQSHCSPVFCSSQSFTTSRKKKPVDTWLRSYSRLGVLLLLLPMPRVCPSMQDVAAGLDSLAGLLGKCRDDSDNGFRISGCGMELNANWPQVSSLLVAPEITLSFLPIADRSFYNHLHIYTLQKRFCVHACEERTRCTPTTGSYCHHATYRGRDRGTVAGTRHAWLKPAIATYKYVSGQAVPNAKKRDRVASHGHGSLTRLRVLIGASRDSCKYYSIDAYDEWRKSSSSRACHSMHSKASAKNRLVDGCGRL